MNKKFLFLFTPLLFVNNLFVLLNGCSSHRCQPRCGYYTKASLIPMDNADSIARPANSSGVLAKAFYLALTLWDTSYYCARKPAPFPLSSAYAECFAYETLETPDSVVLTSDKDFDAMHPAGANLKTLFMINDSVLRYNLHVGINNLYLLQPPVDTGTHAFTIKLYTGRKNLTATSLPVKLLL